MEGIKKLSIYFRPKVSWDDKEFVVNVAEEIDRERKAYAWSLVVSVMCLLWTVIGIILGIYYIYILRLTDEEQFKKMDRKWSTIAKNKNKEIRFVNFPDSLKHLGGGEKTLTEEDRLSVNKNLTPELESYKVEHDQEQSIVKKIPDSSPSLKTKTNLTLQVLGIIGLVIGVLSLVILSWIGGNMVIKIIYLVICIVGLIFSLLSMKENKIIGIIGLVLCSLGSLIQIVKLIRMIIALVILS